jgi:hypothetical protein
MHAYEIFNPKLQAEYDSFKLNAGATLEEVAVFHGTHANLIDKIADEGFDPNKNKVHSVLGGTIYVSPFSNGCYPRYVIVISFKACRNCVIAQKNQKMHTNYLIKQ